MTILFDSSAWIGYFNQTAIMDEVENILKNEYVVTNEVVLCEVLPHLMHRKQFELAYMLEDLPRIPLSIDWEGIREKQQHNITNGINGIGLPDLIIWQQVQQHADLELYTFDKHFELLK